MDTYKIHATQQVLTKTGFGFREVVLEVTIDENNVPVKMVPVKISPVEGAPDLGGESTLDDNDQLR